MQDLPSVIIEIRQLLDAAQGLALWAERELIHPAQRLLIQEQSRSESEWDRLQVQLWKQQQEIEQCPCPPDDLCPACRAAVSLIHHKKRSAVEIEERFGRI